MMVETFIITTTVKHEKYEELIPQITALLADEEDLIAKLANLSAALKSSFNWLWVGFYLVKNKQLVLGPFQGPIACTRINYNKGVCGAAWAQQKTLIVPDVNQFPGHIACSSLSKSEIVIPFSSQQNEIIGVLDIDSEIYHCFDEIDRLYLEKIVKFI